MKRSMRPQVSICAATFVAALLTGFSTSAGAVQIFATSYDLYNGSGTAGYGNVRLYDDTYHGGSGSNTTPYAFLSGGLGDLTDGIAATLNWGDCGGASPCISGPTFDNRPYIGWNNSSLSSIGSPAVTFHFASGTNIDEVKISMNYGYHASPILFEMGGVGSTMIIDPSYSGGGANHWYDISGLALSGDSLKMTFYYNPTPPFGPANWILISEVQFFSAAPAIPEPETYAMMLAGLGLLGFFARRQKHIAA